MLIFFLDIKGLLPYSFEILSLLSFLVGFIMVFRAKKNCPGCRAVFFRTLPGSNGRGLLHTHMSARAAIRLPFNNAVFSFFFRAV